MRECYLFCGVCPVDYPIGMTARLSILFDRVTAVRVTLIFLFLYLSGRLGNLLKIKTMRSKNQKYKQGFSIKKSLTAVEK